MDHTQNTEVAEVSRLLADLSRQHFYGAVEIKMESGKVTLVRKSENLKVGGNGWQNRRRDLGADYEQR